MLVSPASLLTESLRKSHRGAAISRIMAAALNAADPAEAVRRSLHWEGDALHAGDFAWRPAEGGRVYLVAAGKASVSMAEAAADVLGEWLYAGIIVAKRGQAPPEAPHPRLYLYEASHPVPGEDSVQATRRIRALLSETRPDDLVLALISGGGSALMTAPVPGVSLAALQSLTRYLLACGADIREINCLRKHLDAVKGGGLARWAAPAAVLTLILSDVVGSPLDVIASGPTVPDPTTFLDALAILRKYDLVEKTPPEILEHLRRGAAGEIPETGKETDPVFEGVRNLIVGDNPLAARAALKQAAAEGFRALLLTTALQGEAREAGRFLAAILSEIARSENPLPRPACLVAGGETTVTLRGEGLGGRNQELALGAVRDLAGLPGLVLVSLATDGGDGPTDAAGAVVTGETLVRARQAGLSPEDFLRRNDSYHFFEALGDLLKPGPTQTNVNDLTFLFALPPLGPTQNNKSTKGSSKMLQPSSPTSQRASTEARHKPSGATSST